VPRDPPQESQPTSHVSFPSYTASLQRLRTLALTAKSDDLLRNFIPTDPSAGKLLTFAFQLRPSTIKSYTVWILQFLDFVSQHFSLGFIDDITPMHITNFLWNLAKRGLVYATLKVARTSISHIFRTETTNPANAQLVTATMKALTNVCSKKPTKALPISPQMIRDLFEVTDFHNYLDTRDFTVMYLGWLCGTRGTEQSELLAENISFESTYHENKETGLVIVKLERSKTKSASEGAVIVLAAPPASSINPIRILERYLLLRQDKFKNASPWMYPNSGRPKKAITRATISHIVKKQVTRLGYPPKGYSSHSLRVGMVTSAVASGVPTSYIKEHGRWASMCWTGYFNDPEYAHLKASAGLLAALETPRPHSTYTSLIRNPRQ